MSLNEDQAAAFEAVKSGKNIFLTGPAGAGKSFLIRHLVQWFADAGKPLAVTALTGCAALLLGNKAKTLHSWAGIGLGRESADALAAAILRKPASKSRWRRTAAIIIDEISMMTPELFEKLDAIGRKVRANNAPWGGIQLILCGDFFQLPPVSKGLSGELPGRFAFESPQWRAAGLVPVALKKIERQTDSEFQTLLNECRVGEPTAATIALLKSRQGQDWKARLIRPTLLFSRNADVDMVNERNIAALAKPIHTYEARTVLMRPADDPALEMPTGEVLERLVSRLDNDAPYTPHLELCAGAQVMLLTNLDLEGGLANGSRGVVVDFVPESGDPIVQFLVGEPRTITRHTWESPECAALHREQIPLRVAYAITIHKSQGATLDCALVDIGASTFEYGQAYVALSRVRDLESLYVHSLVPSKIRAHPTVVRFYETLTETAPAVESLSPTAVVPAGGAGAMGGGSAAPAPTFGVELTDEGWRGVVTAWAATEVGRACLARVAERAAAGVKIYPPQANVLDALKYTALKNVKVILLGQDPYHGEGQAHGLSFSVQHGHALPPSLRNIRREMLADLGVGDGGWPAGHGSLVSWAQQGVLLLNAVLTVEAGNADSHAGIGWEALTGRLLEAVVCARADAPLVILAWGRKAQNIVYKLPLKPKHVVLASVHPSPLSANNGFFGSKPFSRTNAHLETHGETGILWQIPGAGATATEDPE